MRPFGVFGIVGHLSNGELHMPIHDWTRVQAGLFHDFHTGWIGSLRAALNGGLLPEDFYALVEQNVGSTVPDVLTLQTDDSPPLSPDDSITGAVALVEAPPQVQFTAQLVEDDIYTTKRRTFLAYTSAVTSIASEVASGAKLRKCAILLPFSQRQNASPGEARRPIVIRPSLKMKTQSYYMYLAFV